MDVAISAVGLSDIVVLTSVLILGFLAVKRK